MELENNFMKNYKIAPIKIKDGILSWKNQSNKWTPKENAVWNGIMFPDHLFECPI